ncbi:MAG: response regulator [Elusimicrobia bacterium]|nr:response regulator [Elusimicrobiota bacterium]
MAQILICDDDRHFFEMAALGLRAKQHRVEWAKDPIDLNAALIGYTPDLVILDTQMPEGGGPEAKKILEARYGDKLPLVFCSGMPIEHQKKWYPPAPTCRYVNKPTSLDSLIAVVQDLLKQFPPAPQP